jgi:endonuclease/exonuclease/phosphatase family metal-dependent hydrolase
MAYKILFSNIGYARGIDGSLKQHIGYVDRHFYCNVSVQEQVLSQFKNIMSVESPDLCCLVEIDQGSLHSAGFNQLERLMDEDYRFFDIADKYGPQSRLGNMLFHQGKSNAFLSKGYIDFEHLYFKNGTKRLIYRLMIPGNIAVFFAHFSLSRKVRMKQFQELRTLVNDTQEDVIVLADFNIFKGFKELEILLHDNDLFILNKEHEPTFTFHTRKMALDLCICSRNLVSRLELKIISQPFSDHAALLLQIREG